VKVRQSSAKRLTIPGLTIALPHTLELSEVEPLPPPVCLPLAPQVETAENLMGRASTASNIARGTVAFVTMALHDETSPALNPSRTTGKTRNLGKVRLALKPEIPLSKRLAYVLQPPTDLLLAVIGPLEWPRPLFEYQMEGIKALLGHEALLLADDMGLGKTVQAIGALRILILQRHIESSLLIVPAGLINQWHRELGFWAPELRISTVHGPVADRAWQWITPAHIYLTSYETFRSDFTANPQ